MDRKIEKKRSLNERCRNEKSSRNSIKCEKKRKRRTINAGS